MKHETVAQMCMRKTSDKQSGVKHTPLHTLQECCEAADINPKVFGRLATKHEGAPKPVLQNTKTAWRGQKLYYRKHEFVQWVNEVRQQKEKVMPDIKSALQQALAKTANAWAADDEAHQKIEPVQVTTPEETAVPAPVTNNVSRATFEYVRDNPGLTVMQITDALVAQGFKANSVSSLCYQMVKVRLVVADANGKLTAVVREYAPIQINKRRNKTKPKAAVKAAAGLASIAPVVTVDAPLPRKHIEITNTRTGEVINTRKEEWTAKSVVDTLSVYQAMAVYNELRKIFEE